MKREPFFCHSNKPFCTKTFVNTAHRRQNHHYFPILCIFTQAFVDLTNNSQVFCFTLSWIFHLLAKKWFKKSHVHEFTDTKKTTGCESFARGLYVYTPGDSQQQLSGAIQFYHFPNHVSCQIPSEKRLKRLLLSK